MAEPTLTERHARVGRLLDEIQAKCDAATPGPWGPPVVALVALSGAVADAAFIASSRTWLPALLTFTRAEWDEAAAAITRAGGAYTDQYRARMQYDSDAILTRLESALASLLEVDHG